MYNLNLRTRTFGRYIIDNHFSEERFHCIILNGCVDKLNFFISLIKYMCILSIQNHLLYMYCCIVHVINPCSNDTHSVYNKYSVVMHVHVLPIYTYNVHIQYMFLLWITYLMLKLQLNSRK